ncbi:hypothetical protein COO60DRAFT_295434 [Scenedesmus sp. NREL 46B-D3]|nr:hypothetical protein COO60DRAFT_295434 [Scenedesmus sp. NREL 46B-D3]
MFVQEVLLSVHMRSFALRCWCSMLAVHVLCFLFHAPCASYSMPAGGCGHDGVQCPVRCNTCVQGGTLGRCVLSLETAHMCGTYAGMCAAACAWVPAWSRPWYEPCMTCRKHRMQGFPRQCSSACVMECGFTAACSACVHPRPLDLQVVDCCWLSCDVTVC